MNICIEDLKGLWKRVIVTVPCEVINTAIHDRFLYLSKTIYVHGFRIGKVPVSFLKKNYEKNVQQEVMMRLMQQGFNDIVIQKKINPISAPIFNVIQMCDDSVGNFIYSVIVEVYPEIMLKDLNDIKVEKLLVDITEDDVNLVMKYNTQRCVSWKLSDKIIKVGDRVTFDIFVDSHDIKKYKNYNIGDITMIIDQNNHTLSSLIKNMIGRNIGDKFNIDIDIPNGYHLDNLEEQYISFFISIKKVEVPKYLSLNQNYIKGVGDIDNISSSDVRMKIRKYMQKNINKIINYDIKNQIINSILDFNEIIVSSTLMQNQLSILMESSKRKIYINEIFEIQLLYSLFLRSFNLSDQAKYHSKIVLLLSVIAKTNNIKIDSNSFLKNIKNKLGTSDIAIKNFRCFKNNKIAIKYVNDILLEETVINLILSHVTVTERKIKFNELMLFNKINRFF